VAVIFLLIAFKVFTAEKMGIDKSKQLIRIEHYIALKRPDIRIEELKTLAKQIVEQSEDLVIPADNQINFLKVDQVAFLAAVIYTESYFNRKAISHAGAMGYMQLMPATAFWLGKSLSIDHISQNVWQTEINIKLGVYYINALIREMGTLRSGMLAYNAGPSAVRSWGGVPAYWTHIIAYYNEILFLDKEPVIPELAALTLE